MIMIETIQEKVEVIVRFRLLPSEKVYKAIADAYTQLNDAGDLLTAPGVTLWPA